MDPSRLIPPTPRCRLCQRPVPEWQSPEVAVLPVGIVGMHYAHPSCARDGRRKRRREALAAAASSRWRTLAEWRAEVDGWRGGVGLPAYEWPARLVN